MSQYFIFHITLWTLSLLMSGSETARAFFFYATRRIKQKKKKYRMGFCWEFTTVSCKRTYLEKARHIWGSERLQMVIKQQ